MDIRKPKPIHYWREFLKEAGTIALEAEVAAILGLAVMATNSAQAAPIDRDGIVGVWQLVRIDFIRDGKPAKDPNFAANPTGEIIYDRSGWMGVQIVTAPRPVLTEKPRTSGVNSAADAQAKAAAMDSYYAYYGRWTFDAATSVVHHRLNASLLPYETGTEKIRDAKFDGQYLSLIVHAPKRENWTRTLVWKRQP